jgi:hypothetical protein
VIHRSLSEDHLRAPREPSAAASTYCEVAAILAHGYLRLVATKESDPRKPACATADTGDRDRQNCLDVARRSKHELDDSSPTRRPPCKHP